MDDAILQDFMTNITGAVKVMNNKIASLTEEVNSLRGLVNLKVMGNVEVVEKPIYIPGPTPSVDLLPIITAIGNLSFPYTDLSKVSDKDDIKSLEDAILGLAQTYTNTAMQINGKLDVMQANIIHNLIDNMQSKHNVITESLNALHAIPSSVAVEAPHIDLTCIEMAFVRVREELQDVRNLLSSLTLPVPVPAITVEPPPVTVDVAGYLPGFTSLIEQVRSLQDSVNRQDAKSPNITVEPTPVTVDVSSYLPGLDGFATQIKSLQDIINSQSNRVPDISIVEVLCARIQDTLAALVDILSKRDKEQWCVQNINTPSVIHEVTVLGTEITADIQDNITAEVEDVVEPHV